MSVLKKLSEVKQVTLYVPALNKVTGSPENTLLLTQVYYWSRVYDHKKFYKNIYNVRPEEKKLGQKSWCEELGFTRYQIRKSFDKLIDLGFINLEIQNRTHKTYIGLNLNKFVEACKAVKIGAIEQLSPVSEGSKPPLLTVVNGPFPKVEHRTIPEITQRLPERDLKLSELKKMLGDIPEEPRRKIVERVKNYLSKFKVIGITKSFKKSVLALEIEKYIKQIEKNK